jgi:uncharacterized protein (TIGR02391 family)
MLLAFRCTQCAARAIEFVQKSLTEGKAKAVMARKRVVPPPPPEPPREFRSPQEIEIAIAKLKRLIQGLEKLDIAAAVINNTGADSTTQNDIRAAILEVFGANSPEYQEHQHLRIWAGGAYQNTPMREVIDAMKSGRARVIGILEGLIGRLEEKRSNLTAGTGAVRLEKKRYDPVAQTSAAPSTYGDCLNLHPRIRDVAREPFLGGHYWEAVSESTKALVNYVKERSGRHDLDGASLVRTVFSRNNPVLAFNGLATETDLDEQEGMMHLFQGAVMAIPNRGGRFFAGDSKQRALEYLSMLSLLAYRLQNATRRASC